VNEDLRGLLGVVERQTGYAVAITRGDIRTHSAMVSASLDQPVHAVYINPQYEKWGDYLAAMQCAMLLIKWADPTRIPDFGLDKQVVTLHVQRIARKVKGLPASSAVQYAHMVVTGLLQQVNSVPMQMMAMEICRKHCPSLWTQQQESVANELREMAGVLAKRVREMSPKEIYERSVAINAAYVYNWAEESGDHSVTLPYEALGYSKMGVELLNAYRAVDRDSKDSYPVAVDAWAHMLDIVGWYTWSYRKAR
jgi:hypothetical protein